MTNFERFLALHHQDTPLLLGNVWDVNSARIFEDHGFKALGTSSAAIANMLGYADGEEIPFPELIYIVRRIIPHISVPLSVDLEGGYSRNPSEVISHIEQLDQLGVVGINIEDSLVENERVLRSTEDFSDFIETIKNQMLKRGINLFLNIRTDPFLLGMEKPLEETLKRVAAFEQAGADGIFVPGITQEEDIKAVVSATKLPVNVMCMPELPSFRRLTELGVKKISMGNFIHNSLTEQIGDTLRTVQEQQSFATLF